MKVDEQILRFLARNLARVWPAASADLALKIFTTPRRYPRAEWESEIADAGKKIRIGELAAVRWGDENAPQVLLVHGWQGRGTQLAAFAEPLTSKGFGVIALDGPAHGRSPGDRTNVYAFSRALIEVGASIGPLHAIIAHSFGAGATVLACDDGLKTRSVVMIASPSRFDWIIDGFSQSMGFDETQAARFQAKLAEWAGVDARGIDLTLIGKRMTIPLLIAHDPKDRDVPFRSAEEIFATWSNAKLLTLDNVGHRRILRSRRLIAAVTDFLVELRSL